MLSVVGALAGARVAPSHGAVRPRPVSCAAAVRFSGARYSPQRGSGRVSSLAAPRDTSITQLSLALATSGGAFAVAPGAADARRRGSLCTVAAKAGGGGGGRKWKKKSLRHLVHQANDAVEGAHLESVTKELAWNTERLRLTNVNQELAAEAARLRSMQDERLAIILGEVRGLVGPGSLCSPRDRHAFRTRVS